MEYIFFIKITRLAESIGISVQIGLKFPFYTISVFFNWYPSCVKTVLIPFQLDTL